MFNFRRLDAVGRLKAGEWSGELERDGLIKKALGSKGTIDPEEILDLLLVRDTAIRKAALIRIHKLEDDAIIDSLMRRAPDLSAQVTQGLARVLIKVLPKGWHRRLSPYLGHEDESVRNAAEELFSASKLGQALLEAADIWLREDSRIAVRLMERLAKDIKMGGQDRRGWIGAIDRALAHHDPEVRNRAWQCLDDDRVGDYVERMVKAVGRETTQNQTLIWQILSKIASGGHADLSETLIPLLGDDRGSVRAAAVKLLGLTRDRDATVRGFIRHACSMSDWAQERAFESLRTLGDAVMQPVMAMMKDSNREVRILAISLAAGLGDERNLVSPLLEALEEGDWWIRARIIAALGRLAEPATFGRLEALLSDRDETLVAADALATAALRHTEENRAEIAERALTPLKNLAMGTKIIGTDDPVDSADLRREIILILSRVRTIEMLDFMTSLCQSETEIQPATAALEAAESLAEELGQPIPNLNAHRETLRLAALAQAKRSPLEDLLMTARDQGASDLFVVVGKPPLIRRQGVLTAMANQQPLAPFDTERYVRAILDDAQAMIVAQRGALEFCLEIQGVGRQRASVFVDTQGVNAVFRIIPREVPALEDIGLPTHMGSVAYWKNGLLLVFSPQGEGKTTTLASMVEHINTNRNAHVITLESPIEYLHRSRMSTISQREIGTNTTSLTRGLYGALRQDPDVIVIDPLVDAEALSLALRAANSGRLVLASIAAPTVESGLERLLDAFEVEQRATVRRDLAEALKGIIVQGLVPRANGHAMAAVHEIVVATPEVRTVVRAGTFDQLGDIIAGSLDQGMQPFDTALMSLVSYGTIKPQTAYRRARRKETFEPLLKKKKRSKAATAQESP